MLEIVLVLIMIFLLGLSSFIMKENKSLHESIEKHSLDSKHFEEAYNHLKEDYSIIQAQQKQLEFELTNEKTKNDKIISQKKSSETRLGLTSEVLAPFLKDFPYEPKYCHFLGNPLDYVVFDVDAGELVFLEIKAGNSKESSKQKAIKNIIKSGRVYYEQIRINEKGVKIKREENNE